MNWAAMFRAARPSVCIGLLGLQTSCAGAVGSTGVEDKARRDVPIAICRRPLNAGDTTEGGAPQPEIYWKTLFPRFHGFGAAMDTGIPDCVGDRILVTPATSSSATVVSKDDLTVSPGEDGLQAVWLRASASDNNALGPLALLRSRPSELDVYAIGLYRGSAHHSRFDFGKLGTTTILSARDEACADAKPSTECESTLSFYLLGSGHLTAAGKTTLQRIQFATMKGIGRIQARLTTDPPVFEGETIKVKEKLSIRDSGEDEVRRSEGERVFTIRGTELVANKESIWAQVVQP
jgi:hypothetical protein